MYQEKYQVGTSPKLRTVHISEKKNVHMSYVELVRGEGGGGGGGGVRGGGVRGGGGGVRGGGGGVRRGGGGVRGK